MGKGQGGSRGQGGSTGRRGIQVDAARTIPAAELEVRATRSGGPGGQNVNRVATRVEVRFDLAQSSVFDAEEKRRIRTRLAGRVSAAGILRVVSQKHRSRSRNEEEARARLAELLRAALTVPRRRRRTKPTGSARERRLRDKKRRSARKRERGAPGAMD